MSKFLNFRVQIEVPDHIGEADVPYLREMLISRIDHIHGYPQVTYEGIHNMEFFEGVEKEEFEAGRIEL